MNALEGPSVESECLVAAAGANIALGLTTVEEEGTAGMEAAGEIATADLGGETELEEGLQDPGKRCRVAV